MKTESKAHHKLFKHHQALSHVTESIDLFYFDWLVVFFFWEEEEAKSKLKYAHIHLTLHFERKMIQQKKNLKKNVKNDWLCF